jgi:hypothetical protein
MTAGRRLAYDFLNLPHHVKLRIAAKFGFVSDPKASEQENYVLWFRQAKQENKVEELRQEIADA